MAKVELKQPVVAEISELLNGAQTAVVVDYYGPIFCHACFFCFL